MVGAAGLVEAVGEGLQHHPLGRTHRPQRLELIRVQGAGIRVGEEAGLGEHCAGCRDDIVDGRAVPVVGEPSRGGGVPRLRCLAEREQRFVAAGGDAAAGDRQDRIQVEKRVIEAGRRLGERAVAAPVSAEHRERHKDLGGIRHPAAVGTVTHRRGRAQQLAGLGLEQIAKGRGSRRAL